ncbi:MAG: MFS transporter [Propionibacteriaceae bacterium]|jgi:MFS family permease|nr:MFS transporter [Propionibacteriaceae bacterium]
MTSIHEALEDPNPARLKSWIGTRAGRLATALLTVELIAGMQSFMHAIIAPQIAQDLSAVTYFGLMYSAVLASSFVTLPWGPKLLARFGVPTLMTYMTLLNAVGAIVSAASPSIGVFLLGRFLAGLSVGVLATASMSAVVQHLPKRWRQLVLATFSGTYIISSFIGPAYAAAVAHAFNWRIAMILYLPALFAARFVISKNVAPSDKVINTGSTPPAFVAVAMPIAALFLSLSLEILGQFAWAGLLLGAVLLVGSAVRVLPQGTFTLKRGRPRAVLVFFLLTGAYFAVDFSIPLALQTVLASDVTQVALVVSVGGLAWAIVGFACGRRPASYGPVYRRRTSTGTVLLSIGFGSIALDLLVWHGYWGVLIGWTVASIGMGLTYLDTMNSIFTPPDVDDGLDDSDAVSAVALSEPMSAVLFATPFLAIAGFLVAEERPNYIGYMISGTVVLAAFLIAIVRPAGDNLPTGFPCGSKQQ